MEQYPRTLPVVCSLFKDTSSVTQNYSAEWKGDKLILNWRGYGRKRPWPDLRYYPGICLEGQRKATKTQSGEPNRDLNPGPPKYKAGFLTQDTTFGRRLWYYIFADLRTWNIAINCRYYEKAKSKPNSNFERNRCTHAIIVTQCFTLT
jgi:hypothetical protein